MSGHVLTQLQRTDTPQEAIMDTLSLQHRHTNQAEPTTLPKLLFDMAPGTFTEPSFGYDFSRVPVHTDMVKRTQPLLRTRPMVQRYPVNGDEDSAQCSTCSDEESTPISASAELSAEPTSQANEATPTTDTPEPEEESTAPKETTAPALLVEDLATELVPGQMRKSEFLAVLRTEVTRVAESALAGTGRATADCPYLDYWFDYYSEQDSSHIERAIRRYAPEASSATSARDYIPIVVNRVRRSVETWVRTGEVTGVPEGVPTTIPGTGGGSEVTAASSGPVMAKSRDGGVRSADNPQAIQAELGQGRPLDSGVRSRMESAFGMDFSHVRTHTDTAAAGLSNLLNARAFTVGEHVAFGSGEYRPGTLIGDALIAHEMAHVIQQSGASDSVAPMQTGEAGYDMLENDADKSATGVLTSLWGVVKGELLDIAQNAMPKLRSGLCITRCPKRSSKRCPKHNVITRTIDIFELAGRSVEPKAEVTAASKIWKREAGISLNPIYNPPVSEQRTRALIGTESDESSKSVNQLELDYSPIPTGTLEMDNLRRLAGDNFTAFFIPELGYIAPAAVDPELSKGIVYIGGTKCSSGFTLAHELGHLFLGGGHKNWDSPLMRPARCNPSLTELECRMARGDNYAWREFFQQGGKL